MSTTEDIIGRQHVNDLDAILAVTNTDVDAHDPHGAGQRRRHLHLGLHARAPARPSRSSTRRPRPRSGTARPTSTGRSRSTRRPSWPPTPLANGRRRRRPQRHRSWASGPTRSGPSSASQSQNWMLSQFMHGEQGALICTAKIVETVPWIDAKYYAATQVMDEARHVEVFAKYLDEKLSGAYPINAHLKMLLDDIVARQPLGHDLPRHADHGRGPRPRRLRVHAPDDHRAAAQAAAALRHERRGPPRGLRRAVAEGVLRRAHRRRAARAPGVRLRGGGAHARPLPPAGGLGADGRAGQGGHRGGPRRGSPTRSSSSRCCSPRSCRTARSSACSTPATAGCATASPSSA